MLALLEVSAYHVILLMSKTNKPSCQNTTLVCKFIYFSHFMRNFRNSYSEMKCLLLRPFFAQSILFTACKFLRAGIIFATSTISTSVNDLTSNKWPKFCFWRISACAQYHRNTLLNSRSVQQTQNSVCVFITWCRLPMANTLICTSLSTTLLRTSNFWDGVSHKLQYIIFSSF